MSDSSNPVRDFAKPMIDLMVLNAETTGAIWLRQNQVVAELVQAGVERARAVAASKDLAEAFRLQQEFGREVVEKMTATGRENWETVREAYGKAGEVVRSAYQSQQAA